MVDGHHYQDILDAENAPHEGTFWSRQIHELILDFFKKNL
jgi:hypothetical protein